MSRLPRYLGALPMALGCPLILCAPAAVALVLTPKVALFTSMVIFVGLLVVYQFARGTARETANA